MNRKNLILLFLICVGLLLMSLGAQSLPHGNLLTWGILIYVQSSITRKNLNK